MAATHDYERLLSLVPPPVEPKGFDNWPELERRLGTPVPADYKWLVSTYGAGSFDSFLHVLQPTSPYKPIRLVESARRAVEVLQFLKRADDEEVPFAPRELLPVAKTENGDTVYWLARPKGSPDEWRIVCNPARSDTWSRFDGGIVDFLTAVYERRHRVPFFPEDFPAASPVFAKQFTPDEMRRYLAENFPQMREG
jgi:hypothetical protein